MREDSSLLSLQEVPQYIDKPCCVFLCNDFDFVIIY